MLKKLKQYQFLFEELVRRDFQKKFKGTVLGAVWSILSPLLTLSVMRLVFTSFFGRNTPFYTTYLFAGNLVFSYFKESTSNGMTALTANKAIITKVNIPKYMFLLSSNVSALINFGLTMILFFLFAAIDGVTFSWRFIMLLYPVFWLVIFNLGVGLILSALYVFFKDTGYLYNVLTMLLMYMSAIFYTVDSFSPTAQRLFLLNPMYVYIKYFRIIVIDGNIPSLMYHLLPIGYALAVLALGAWMYKHYNRRFLYHM